MGCTSTEGSDCIEHYAHCRVTHTIAKKTLRLHFEGREALEWFLLARSECGEPTNLTCIAVLIYAVYNTVNCRRRNGDGSMKEAEETMEQYVIAAIRDHPASEKIINGRWVVEGGRRKRRKVEELVC